MARPCRWMSWKVLSVVVVAAGCRSKPTPRPPEDVTALWEPRIVVRSSGPSATTKVPSGVLSGLVVDALTGAPVVRAQVVVRYESSTLTDSVGRFRLTLPKRGATVEVHSVGYIDALTGASYRPDSGQVAVFAIHRLGLQCMGDGDPALSPAVIVVARDVVTGEAPASPVSVIAQSGDYRDSVMARAESTQPVVVRSALGRRGRFTVIVRSEGYRVWSSYGGTRPQLNCGSQLAPAVFHAWLIPE